MAPDQLPEEVSLWPTDLHGLFDLQPGYGKDDLKRSYTRPIDHLTRISIRIRQLTERQNRIALADLSDSLEMVIT